MAKYYQVNRAWQLYEEAQQKKLILPTETYNSILKVVNFLKESFELRWSFIVNLLTDMNKTGVKPDLRTLNAILQSLSTMGNASNIKDTVLQVLREFKDLGIEPSLGSWYNVLITFCKEREYIFHLQFIFMYLTKYTIEKTSNWYYKQIKKNNLPI